MTNHRQRSQWTLLWSFVSTVLPNRQERLSPSHFTHSVQDRRESFIVFLYNLFHVGLTKFREILPSSSRIIEKNYLRNPSHHKKFSECVYSQVIKS